MFKGNAEMQSFPILLLNESSKNMYVMYLQAPLSILLIPVLQLWIPSGGAAQSKPNMSFQWRTKQVSRRRTHNQNTKL